MEKATIKATARNGKPKKLRRDGLLPGVLNGPGAVSTPVQFDAVAMNRLIGRYGPAAKLWVGLDGSEKFGFIKEIQRHPVEGKIIHVTIQLASTDQNVRMQLPLLFQGIPELEHRQLQLQVDKSEVEVEGEAGQIPGNITIDVSKRNYGDAIGPADFSVPAGVRILSPQEETFASVRGSRKVTAEEPEEVSVGQ